jgi:Protein of unknown function (DUF3151)
MSELPVNEPLEVRITEPSGSLAALNGGAYPSDVAARFPQCLTAWAELGDRSLGGGHVIQAYAFYRVGYHRGLDRIREAGWRGKGRVLWSHMPNRGFLRSLRGLAITAAEIGEKDEAERCSDFLRQLAPDAPQV